MRCSTPNSRNQSVSIARDAEGWNLHSSRLRIQPQPTRASQAFQVLFLRHATGQSLVHSLETGVVVLGSDASIKHGPFGNPCDV